MIIAGTGHRPNKLGGYTPDVWRKLVRLAYRVIDEQQPNAIISGMAQGWDTALAYAAIERGVQLHAYVPFEGQELKWTPKAQEYYHKLLSQAASVEYVCIGGYAAWKMQARNEQMVEHSDLVVALWDGSNSGTGNCIAYAETIGKPVVNYWQYWKGQP